MRTAVLGAGKMGVWFAKWCKERGDTIVLADRNPQKLAKLKNELGVEVADFPTAVRSSDRVLICVSISSFEEIVKKIAPAIHQGQPVMDICSIKEYPVDIMHKYLKGALVLGTHPVFGPGSNGVKHKAYVLTPTNPEEAAYAEEFKSGQKRGSPCSQCRLKHDELMSLVLGCHISWLSVVKHCLSSPDSLNPKAGRNYLPHAIYASRSHRNGNP